MAHHLTYRPDPILEARNDRFFHAVRAADHYWESFVLPKSEANLGQLRDEAKARYLQLLRDIPMDVRVDHRIDIATNQMMRTYSAEYFLRAHEGLVDEVHHSGVPAAYSRNYEALADALTFIYAPNPHMQNAQQEIHRMVTQILDDIVTRADAGENNATILTDTKLRLPRQFSAWADMAECRTGEQLPMKDTLKDYAVQSIAHESNRIINERLQAIEQARKDEEQRFRTPHDIRRKSPDMTYADAETARSAKGSTGRTI